MQEKRNWPEKGKLCLVKRPNTLKFLCYNQKMSKNSDIHIRAADNSDIPAITEIYSHHVLHGTASFEIDPPSREEMGRRMFDVIGRGLPYFVAVSGDTLVGFAYAAMYRTRVAYRFTLED